MRLFINKFQTRSASFCLVEILLISNHMFLTCFRFCLLHQSKTLAPELIPHKTKGLFRSRLIEHCFGDLKTIHLIIIAHDTEQVLLAKILVNNLDYI